VVIPINTCKKSKMLEINDGYWKLDGKDMPIVTQSAHIGIQKSETNSVMFPKNVKTFICISASIGNRPDSI
jgi:hypothetical protein